MNKEMLYTATKWDILSILSKEPKSPIQIAKFAKTSVANISQQLRLLEIAGIVSSVRIPNRDKGQPRLVYSIVQSTALIIILEKNNAQKKQLLLTPKKSALLKLLLLDDEQKAEQLMQVFLAIFSDLEKIRSIVVDFSSHTIIIKTDSPLVKKKYTSFSIFNKQFKCQYVAPSEAIMPLKGDIFVLYDPSHMEKNSGGEVEV